MGIFHLEERMLWKNIMSTLKPESLRGITKAEFLKPSSQEMAEKVKFAKRCCQHIVALQEDESFMRMVTKKYSNMNKLLCDAPIPTWYDFVVQRVQAWDKIPQDFLTKECPKLTEYGYVASDDISVRQIDINLSVWRKTQATLNTIRNRPSYAYKPGSPEESRALLEEMHADSQTRQAQVALKMLEELGFDSERDPSHRRR